MSANDKIYQNAKALYFSACDTHRSLCNPTAKEWGKLTEAKRAEIAARAERWEVEKVGPAREAYEVASRLP